MTIQVCSLNAWPARYTTSAGLLTRSFTALAVKSNWTAKDEKHYENNICIAFKDLSKEFLIELVFSVSKSIMQNSSSCLYVENKT